MGTKLGEVRHPDGSRKVNPLPSEDDRGWHTEATAGDRVWEWFSTDVTFYTYRITAADSDKYYSHVKGESASVEYYFREHY